jgi:hypothetical protein
VVYNKLPSTNLENKMIEEDKVQVGFFVKPSEKAKLQSLAMENNRTMSGEIAQLINSAYKKMLAAQLCDEQSKL